MCSCDAASGCRLNTVTPRPWSKLIISGSLVFACPVTVFHHRFTDLHRYPLVNLSKVSFDVRMFTAQRVCLHIWFQRKSHIYDRRARISPRIQVAPLAPVPWAELVDDRDAMSGGYTSTSATDHDESPHSHWFIDLEIIIMIHGICTPNSGDEQIWLLVYITLEG